ALTLPAQRQGTPTRNQIRYEGRVCELAPALTVLRLGWFAFADFPPPIFAWSVGTLNAFALPSEFLFLRLGLHVQEIAVPIPREQGSCSTWLGLGAAPSCC
ncbi:MAG: hypothetical protein WBE45_06860, partial [Terriglobales bacterium]